MKKKNEVLIIQKYKGSLKGTISMLITLIISVICYIIVLYLEHNGGLNDNIQVSIIMIRDVLLAIISIVGTTLLTSLFIEKNRKNIDYTELLANDIFASPEFYSNLTEENKEKMFTYLSENFQNKDPVRNEVYNIIRDNLFSDKHIYYYEDFDESTSYYDYGNYSEKRSKRIIKLRSFNEKVKMRKIRLISYRLSPTPGIKTFELIGGSIGKDNEPLIIDKDIILEVKNTRSPFLKKNGYIETYEVSLNKEVTLYPHQDTIISFEYISRVSDGDMSSGVGVSVLCKKFSLNFYAPPEYTVHAHSFGFLDSGDNSSNSDYPNNISVRFDKWLLPYEGVAICVSKNDNDVAQLEAAVTDENDLLLNTKVQSTN